jgi:hypothetical protein
MENRIEVLQIINKVLHLNITEKYYIYKTTKTGTQVNVEDTVNDNCIFNIQYDITQMTLHSIPLPLHSLLNSVPVTSDNKSAHTNKTTTST